MADFGDLLNNSLDDFLLPGPTQGPSQPTQDPLDPTPGPSQQISNYRAQNGTPPSSQSSRTSQLPSQRPPRHPGDVSYEDGDNYRVIPGPRSGSNIFVYGSNGYTVDKWYGTLNAPNYRLHLRCQRKPCKARATIKGRMLFVKAGRPHTCEANGNRDWEINHFKSIMKERASKESTSVRVCLIYLFISAYLKYR